MANVKPLITSFNDIEGVKAGFFGRRHGVSKGIYEALNCGPGSDDDPALVTRNRQFVAKWFGVKPKRLVTAYQIHSPDVQLVRSPWRDGPAQCDALVTDRRNLAICVLTADCGPILFCDPFARVIAAAHSGWKGALSGVIENTVTMMESLGAHPQNIRATIGPLIGKKSYEVGSDFEEQILSQDVEHSKFFNIGADNQLLFDLNGFVDQAIYKTGVHHILHTTCDTYADVKNFFSYRRSVHAGELDYGRQISGICMV